MNLQTMCPARTRFLKSTAAIMTVCLFGLVLASPATAASAGSTRVVYYEPPTGVGSLASIGFNDMLNGLGYSSSVTHPNANTLLGYFGSQRVVAVLTHCDANKVQCPDGLLLSSHVRTRYPTSTSLGNLRLGLIMGCKSSKFAKNLYNQGAKTSIGFSEIVRVDGLKKWYTVFRNQIKAGQSVQNAAGTAKAKGDAAYPGKGINSMKCYGTGRI